MKHIMGPNSGSTLTNVQEDDIQPNACDLRLARIFRINPRVTFTISEDVKTHRGSVEVIPHQGGWFHLDEGHYEIVMQNIITVGPNEAGWVITRSTLVRNGVFITGGLYDSGYEGVMGAVMNVTIGPIRIQVGTRVGQYISFAAESLKLYNGSYGLNSEHDQKYNIKE